MVTASHHYDSGFVHLPPGGWHRRESIDGGHIEASRRRGSGGNAWRASRQGVLHVITTTVGRILRRRIVGRAAAHGKIIDAVGTAYHTYDSVSCIVSSCRREGGIARRTSRQRVLPVITTTVGSTTRHRAAGRAAAHHEQRGSGNTRHHYDTRRRAGGVAWIAFRQWLPPVITTTAVSCICRRAGGIAGRASTVDTSRHRAAAATHGEHQSSGYCLSSLRQWVVYRGIVPPVGRQRREKSLMQ